MCNHHLGGANLAPMTLFSLMCHTTDNQFLHQIVWMNWNHSSYCNSILLMRPISYEMQRTILSRSIYLLEALQKFDRSLIKSFVIQILVAIRIHTRTCLRPNDYWNQPYMSVSNLALGSPWIKCARQRCSLHFRKQGTVHFASTKLTLLKNRTKWSPDMLKPRHIGGQMNNKYHHELLK